MPDPRSRRGRWYSLTAILLICACAVVSGAKSIDKLAEWGQRARTDLLEAIGIRRHLLRWRRSLSTVTIGRVLEHLGGDALGTAIGAYLTDQHRRSAAGPGPIPDGRAVRAIAVDDKALKGSARLDQARRHCSRRSPKAPSPPSRKSRSDRRRTRRSTFGPCSRRWTWPGPWSPSTRSTRSRPTSPG